jgi:hypothetical protein
VNLVTKEVYLKPTRIILLILILSFNLWACVPASKTATPTEVPTEEAPVPVKMNIKPVESDECAACHKDEQHLIETAKPEEIVEKESSGAG